MRNALLASVALASAFTCGSLAAQTPQGGGAEPPKTQTAPTEKAMPNPPAEKVMPTAPQAHPAQNAAPGAARTDMKTTGERRDMGGAKGDMGGAKGMNADEKSRTGDNREQGQKSVAPGDEKRQQTGASEKPAGTGAPTTAPAMRSEQNEQRMERNRLGENGPTNKGDRAQPNLDETQRTKLQSFVAGHRDARTTHPDFDAKVGVIAPQDVRSRPLPSDIASIVPEYRGYDYAVVGDELVIIQPRNREIVMVLPAGGEGRGRVPAYHARLDRRQQQVVYEDVIRSAHPLGRSMHVAVGEHIPTDVELLPLPPTLTDNMPDIRAYRYFVMNREVLLVDPETREIVEIIRR